MNMLRISLTRILLNSSECLNWYAPQRCPIPNSNLRLLRKGGKGREISFAVREPSETEQEKDCGGGHHCLSDLLGRAEKWPFLGLRRGGTLGGKERKGNGEKRASVFFDFANGSLCERDNPLSCL